MTVITRKKIGMCMLALVMLMTVLTTGCAQREEDGMPGKNEISKQVIQNDYTYWEKDNEVRCFVPLSDETNKFDNEQGIKGIGTEELPESFKSIVKRLREAMIRYFNDHYQLDISQRLQRQKIKVFRSSGASEGVMGYVDPADRNILNLNITLFNENSELFVNSYVHESLHQLGIMSEQNNLIDEGITDAFTDLILSEAGMVSIPTPIYGTARSLAYQLIAADKGLPEFYFADSVK